MVAVKARPLRGEGLSSFVKAAAYAKNTSRWIHSKIRERSFLTKGGSYINETKINNCTRKKAHLYFFSRLHFEALVQFSWKVVVAVEDPSRFRPFKSSKNEKKLLVRIKSKENNLMQIGHNTAW